MTSAQGDAQARDAADAVTGRHDEARHAYDVSIGLERDPAVRRFLQERLAAPLRRWRAARVGERNHGLHGFHGLNGTRTVEPRRRNRSRMVHPFALLQSVKSV